MKTGTSAAVISAFIDGRSLRTPSAPVPGGHRLSSEFDPATGGTDLYSYRTIVAVRYSNGTFAVTTKKYSNSTSRWVNHLIRSLVFMGLRPSDVLNITTAVPGRWGGFGPAWAPSPFESVPFITYER